MKTSERHNPLMFEMLINLLFFAFCACVIICVFASAYRQSTQTALKQRAVSYAQSAAAEFSASSLSEEEYLISNGWTTADEGVYVLEKDGCSYTAAVISVIPGISGFRLSAAQNDTEIFAFNVEVYRNE